MVVEDAFSGSLGAVAARRQLGVAAALVESATATGGEGAQQLVDVLGGEVYVSHFISYTSRSMFDDGDMYNTRLLEVDAYSAFIGWDPIGWGGDKAGRE